jgi:hypothetical protein
MKMGQNLSMLAPMSEDLSTIGKEKVTTMT